MINEIECIRAEQYPSLTKGKKYKVEYIREDGAIFIIDDKNEKRGFSQKIFKGEILRKNNNIK